MKHAGRPWPALAALALAVLAVHVALLHGAAGSWQPGVRATGPVMQVRALPANMVPEEKQAPARVRPAHIATKSVAQKAATAPAAAPRQRPPVPSEEAPAPVQPTAEPESAPAAPAPAAAATTAFTIPGSQRLRYEVQAQYRGLSVPGQAELLWRHDGSSYEARLEISAPLLPPRIQRSTGRITPEGLAPLRFSDRSRSEEAAHFERDAGQVVFSTNRPAAPLQPGAQDRLSVLVQLGALLAGDPARFTPGTTLSLQTAGTREAEVWTFAVDADEELALPGGTLRGLKLTRSPRKEFDQKVELWLAPGRDYAPVRLRLTQPNGDWVDLQWSATDRG